MPDWVAYVAIAIALALTFLLLISRKGAAARISGLEQDIEDERARANGLIAAEGQLQLVQQSLRKVELESNQHQENLRTTLADKSSLEAKLDLLAMRRTEIEAERDRANGDVGRLQENLQQEQLLASRAQSTLDSTRKSNDELKDRAQRAEQERDQAKEDLRLKSIELAECTAHRDRAIELANQAKLFVESARDQLKTTFAEAASKVFDEKAVALEQRINQSGETAKKGLEDTLKPFNEQIKQFRERVDTLNESQVKDNASLVGAISELKSLNQNMASTTDALTRALKGNAKIRGNWGETILETVLRASGLEEGTNFTRQTSTTDEETGQRRQPDVIFTLPDGRQVVIDSKVNLIAWSEAHEAEDGEVYHAAMQRHVAALRGHMRDLADKNYPKVIGSQALDLTVLFVPIEGALSVALSMDPNLQIEAWKQRVAFASPNTLMAMLKIVERLWMRDRLQKQVGVIGEEASKLVDSVVAFLEDFRAIEGKLKAVQTAYEGANRRLSESPQSVLQRTKRLVAAGAKGKKLLPEELEPEGSTLPLLADQAEV